MKTLVLSMISIAATLAAMTACTSEGDPIDEIDNGQPVEIKLNGGVTAVTKAAIESNFTADFTALFFRPADGATGTPWSSGDQLYAKVLGANKSIAFYSDETRVTSASQYYNTDLTKGSYLAGCALGNATIATSDNLKDGSISFEIDGTQDIMATAGQEDKNKNNKFTDFTFEHKLAQLAFTIAAGENTTLADVTEAYGKVTKIVVLNQPKDFTLTLAKEPTFAIKSGESSTSEFILKSTNDTDITEQELTASAVPFGGAMMIYPDVTNSEISIKIYTKNFTEGIDVTVKLTFKDSSKTNLEASKKYTIALSFAPTAITSTASVGEWNDGGSGSGSIN